MGRSPSRGVLVDNEDRRGEIRLLLAHKVATCPLQVRDGVTGERWLFNGHIWSPDGIKSDEETKDDDVIYLLRLQ